jgi:hypothetical protein
VSSNLERITREALDLADRFEQRFGDSATVNAVCVIADVSVVKDDEVLNVIDYSCSDTRRYVQVGLIAEALGRAEASNDLDVGEVDDD